jgi:hypothetical protein
MERTNVYTTIVEARTGAQYHSLFTCWPTFDNLRETIEAEILWLKRAAHSADDVRSDSDNQHRAAGVWTRVEELKSLIALLRVLPVVSDPDVTPYHREIKVGDRVVGDITIVASPAWANTAVEKATGAVDAPSDSGSGVV